LNQPSNPNPITNNTNFHPAINILPKIKVKDEANLVGVPTPGKNLGFYSWVIHGSPVLHNNPNSTGNNSFNPLSGSIENNELVNSTTNIKIGGLKKRKAAKKN
jgi:hypothetical protein